MTDDKSLATLLIRIICVDCNITGGAYVNGTESHFVLEFDIDVEPGFKLTKEPRNIIYMPIRPHGRQLIDNITSRLLGDSGKLIDLNIIIKLELKDFQLSEKQQQQYKEKGTCEEV